MDSWVAISCVFVLLAGVFFATKVILEALAQITESFKQDSAQTPIDLDAIKEELLDIVEDTLANLEPPNAFDHLMGALGQFAQMKLMKMSGIEDLANLQPALEEELR